MINTLFCGVSVFPHILRHTHMASTHGHSGLVSAWISGVQALQYGHQKWPIYRVCAPRVYLTCSRSSCVYHLSCFCFFLFHAAKRIRPYICHGTRMSRNEGIKMLKRNLNQLAVIACLRYMDTVLVHFGSNSKEVFGLFCISDSGQELRSIEQHVFISPLRCFCLAATCGQGCSFWKKTHFTRWLCPNSSTVWKCFCLTWHEPLFDSNKENLVFLEHSFRNTPEESERLQFKQD